MRNFRKRNFFGDKDIVDWKIRSRGLYLAHRGGETAGGGGGGGGQGGICPPPALLPGGARGAVLPFAFQYDSNEANAC